MEDADDISSQHGLNNCNESNTDYSKASLRKPGGIGEQLASIQGFPP